MLKEGYETNWEENKKNIVFKVKKDILMGKKNKFRLKTLKKDFNYDIFSKEGLENEFFRTRSEDREKRESDINRERSRNIGFEIKYKDITGFVRELEKEGNREGSTYSDSKEFNRGYNTINNRSSRGSFENVKISSIASRKIEYREQEKSKIKPRRVSNGKQRDNGFDITD